MVGFFNLRSNINKNKTISKKFLQQVPEPQLKEYPHFVDCQFRGGKNLDCIDVYSTTVSAGVDAAAVGVDAGAVGAPSREPDVP